MNAKEPNAGVGVSDAVWGFDKIGEVIGRNPRQTFHMLSSGALAAAGAKKIGNRWCAPRRKLIAFIEAEQPAEMA